ncbi:cadg domain containing protein [Stylonychia lemnae]|uniref:Cadg domain containing protein n=1 Tax=Stylonychia lemnae TaxID=5949 RepID=A0A078ADD0_STYLE|nr:cadg domain containing protein [Stylonychia lemnae]|eukprot:CDW79537.1 cadg domain containing protein [Stylonychia lemnae]
MRNQVYNFLLKRKVHQAAVLLILLLIFEKVDNLSCFGDSTGNYPIVLGGIKDQTKYVSIDMDSNDNVLMSGWTKSSDLTGTSTTLPIIVILDKAGSYTFFMRYQVTFAGEFSTAKFRQTDETQIVGIMATTSYEFKIYLISTLDGSIIAKYGTSILAPLKVSISNDCFVINGDRIYLAMKTDSGYTQIMGFQLTTSDLKVDFYQQSAANSASNNQFDSMYLFGNNLQLLLSGQVRSGSQNYWTLWSFKISDFSNVINLAFHSSNIQSQKMIYKNDGTTNHVYRVGYNANKILYFHYLIVDDAGTVSTEYLYQHDFSDSPSCKSLHPDSSSNTLIYMFIYLSTDKIFLLATLEFVSASSGKLTKHELSNFSRRQNTLIYGYLKGSYQYYIAQVQKLPQSQDQSKDSSLKFLSGALMTTDISQSCLNRDESTNTEVTVSSVQLSADACPDTFNNDKTKITIYYSDNILGLISTGKLLSTTLIYQSWCSSTQPVPQSVAVSDGTYEIFSGNKYFPFTQFTTDLACTDSTWTYSFTSTFDGTSQSSNPFSYDSNTPLRFKASSTTESHAGTYSFQLTGTLNQNSETASTTFNIVVTNPCISVSLTNSGGNHADVLYYLGDAAQTINFSSYFTSTRSTCTRVYEMYTNAALTAAPSASVFLLTQAGVLSYSSSDTTLHGTSITIYIKAYHKYNTQSQFDIATVKITFNKCKLNTATLATLNAYYYYDWGSNAMTFQFTAWTSLYETDCGVFIYTVTYNANSTVIPATNSVIRYTSNTRTFTLFTNSVDHLGTHEIKISVILLTYWVNHLCDYYGFRCYISIVDYIHRLTILPENKNPPSIATPKDQTVTAGLSLKYSLGSVTDADLDGYTATANVGQASSFIKFASMVVTISPPATEKDGTYPVTITIKDDNPVPMTSTYTFNVIIKGKEETASSNNSSSSTSNSTFKGVVIDEVLPLNATQDQKDKKKQSDLLYSKFGVKIYSITNTGILTLQFLDPIRTPDFNSTGLNLTEVYKSKFFSNVVKVYTIPSEYSKVSDLNFNWTEIRDQIRVTFLLNGYFIQQSTGRALKLPAILTKNLPKQLDPGGMYILKLCKILDAALLGALGGSASSSLQGLMMGNMGISIVFSKVSIANLGSLFYYMVGIGCTIIGLILVKYLSRKYRLFASLFAIALLSATFIFPLLVLIVLFVLQSKLTQPACLQKIGSLYDGLKVDQRAALLYNVFFLSRRFLFAITLVIFNGRDNATFQIQVMFLQSLILLVYVIYIKPFQDPEFNYIEIFNETCILMSSYHLMIFTNYVPDIEKQSIFGYTLLAITVLNVAVNTIIMMIKTIYKIKNSFKKLRQKIKLFQRKKAVKRAEIYYLNEQDFDYKEGAFISKVYKNLKNYKDLEDKNSFDSNYLGQTFDQDSPQKSMSRSLTNNFIQEDLTPQKSQIRDNNVIKSIYNFFKRQGRMMPITLSPINRGHSKLNSLFENDRITQAQDIQQSMQLNDIEDESYSQIDKREFNENLTLQQDSTKNLIASQNINTFFPDPSPSKLESTIQALLNGQQMPQTQMKNDYDQTDKYTFRNVMQQLKAQQNQNADSDDEDSDELDYENNFTEDVFNDRDRLPQETEDDLDKEELEI